ncbi:unnamed protein product [Boreogadus saida]
MKLQPELKSDEMVAEFLLESYHKMFNKKSGGFCLYIKKVKKSYEYIKYLQCAILRCKLDQLAAGKGMPRKRTMRPDDPRRLGSLIITVLSTLRHTTAPPASASAASRRACSFSGCCRSTSSACFLCLHNLLA